MEFVLKALSSANHLGPLTDGKGFFLRDVFHKGEDMWPEVIAFGFVLDETSYLRDVWKPGMDTTAHDSWMDVLMFLRSKVVVYKVNMVCQL